MYRKGGSHVIDCTGGGVPVLVVIKMFCMELIYSGIPAPRFHQSIHARSRADLRDIGLIGKYLAVGRRCKRSPFRSHGLPPFSTIHPENKMSSHPQNIDIQAVINCH